MDISKRICYILHDLNQWRNLYSVFMRLWEFLFVRNYIYSILLIFLVHFLLFLLLNADIFNETYEQYSGTCSLSPIWWIVKHHTFSISYLSFSLWIWGTLFFPYLIALGNLYWNKRAISPNLIYLENSHLTLWKHPGVFRSYIVSVFCNLQRWCIFPKHWVSVSWVSQNSFQKLVYEKQSYTQWVFKMVFPMKTVKLASLSDFQRNRMEKLFIWMHQSCAAFVLAFQLIS